MGHCPTAAQMSPFLAFLHCQKLCVSACLQCRECLLSTHAPTTPTVPLHLSMRAYSAIAISMVVAVRTATNTACGESIPDKSSPWEERSATWHYFTRLRGVSIGFLIRFC